MQRRSIDSEIRALRNNHSHIFAFTVLCVEERVFCAELRYHNNLRTKTLSCGLYEYGEELTGGNMRSASLNTLCAIV
jgi:hypothetical protein